MLYGMPSMVSLPAQSITTNADTKPSCAGGEAIPNDQRTWTNVRSPVLLLRRGDVL